MWTALIGSFQFGMVPWNIIKSLQLFDTLKACKKILDNIKQCLDCNLSLLIPLNLLNAIFGNI